MSEKRKGLLIDIAVYLSAFAAGVIPFLLIENIFAATAAFTAAARSRFFILGRKKTTTWELAQHPLVAYITRFPVLWFPIFRQNNNILSMACQDRHAAVKAAFPIVIVFFKKIC